MDRDDLQSPGARRPPRMHRKHGGEGDDDDDNDDHDDDDDGERSHLRRVCDSYRQYAAFHAARELGVRRRNLRLLSSTAASPANATIESILPPHLRPDSPEYRQRSARLRDAAVRNQYFLDRALRHAHQETSQEALRRRRRQGNPNNNAAGWEWVTEDELSKVDSVLKSVARDWSAEGREERDVAYDRIIGAILRYVPLPTTWRTSSGGAALQKRNHMRVAVPGSGLGRLAWEIRSRGYSVEGSDFSLHMLLASDFVLNGRHTAAGDSGGGAVGGDTSSSCPKFAISPWLAEAKNVRLLDDRLRTVIVPDVDPAAIGMPRWNDNEADGGDEEGNDDDDEDDSPEFTMLAGEFLDLYSHFLPSSGQRRLQDEDDDDPHRRRKFHAVACSYFLDTAPSLPHYLLTIYHMLEYGGLLVHFGPLMFHWSGHGCLVPDDVDAANDGGRGGNEDIHDYKNGTSYDKRNERMDPRYLCSIDYTWEEVRGMIVNCGFAILEEEQCVPSRYASDDRSMMKVVYDCVFCVARKERGGDERRMIDG